VGARALALALAAAAELASAQLATAQAPLRSSRAANAMPAHYSEPFCQLRGNHYKTTDAITGLHEALLADKPETRARKLEEGRDRVLDAIAHDNQGKSSVAWYTLAQIYLYQGDVMGADSALRHTQEIVPKCAQPIEALRYTLWAPLVNAGAEFSKAGAPDSALALFREAAAIYPEKPEPLMSAGVVFANGGQTDSAIVYFERAAAAAERAGMTEERNQATHNLAAMLQRAERHQEAASALEKYLAWVPGDADAKRALAGSYRALGRKDDAKALDGELGTRDTAATAEDVMRTAVNFYEDKKYAEAAQAFERALAAAPYSRDAIFGLAACYQALEDGAKLLQAAQKLVAIEPLNPDALSLLASGYRRAKQPDQAVETAKQLVGLQASLAVQSFTTTADSATLTATATGRAAETARGKAVPPGAVVLVFEFVDSAGKVAASEEATIPALKPKETSALTVHARGKAVVAWRYRRKG
jgi:tetratricopeptide (TPR) repeat protein